MFAAIKIVHTEFPVALELDEREDPFHLHNVLKVTGTLRWMKELPFVSATLERSLLTNVKENSSFQKENEW